MKAILWDMDGTLIDTEPKWGAATYAMAAEMGRELSPEVREKTVGGIAENTVRLCADWAGLRIDDDATLQHWVDRLYDLVSERFAEELPLRPGIEGLLTGADDGVPMMVVTNTYRRLADRAMQTIGAHRFVGAVCGDEVAAGKPAPDPYREACRRLGLPADACLVIEDSTNGMRSAVSAGCRVLGVPAPGTPVSPGAVTVGELLPGHCDLNGLEVSDLRELWGRIGAASPDVPQCNP